jgi:RNA methyltransferase, TrmH family
MGTMLRTAAAAGVDAVFYTPGSADPFSPKVLRSTAGAVFHIDVAQVREPLQLVESCKAKGMQVAAARPRSDQPYWEADFKRPTY